MSLGDNRSPRGGSSSRGGAQAETVTKEDLAREMTAQSKQLSDQVTKQIASLGKTLAAQQKKDMARLGEMLAAQLAKQVAELDISRRSSRASSLAASKRDQDDGRSVTLPGTFSGRIRNRVRAVGDKFKGRSKPQHVVVLYEPDHHDDDEEDYIPRSGVDILEDGYSDGSAFDDEKNSTDWVYQADDRHPYEYLNQHYRLFAARLLDGTDFTFCFYSRSVTCYVSRSLADKIGTAYPTRFRAKVGGPGGGPTVTHDVKVTGRIQDVNRDLTKPFSVVCGVVPDGTFPGDLTLGQSMFHKWRVAYESSPFITLTNFIGSPTLRPIERSGS